MSPDSLPHISLGTAALVIFALCAGFVVLRGMTRMIIGTLILGVSAWAGFLVWQLAPTLAVEFGKSTPWITTGLPVAAFITAFFLLRKTSQLIARPFGEAAPPRPPRSAFGLTFRLLLAIIPTALIWLIGAAFVHHRGSIDEVRAISEKSTNAGKETFSQRFKSALDATLPAEWLKKLDPLADPSRLALAKLITAQSQTPPAPTIDPGTGQAIPRAIIVDEPELQNLAREGNFGTLLRHPHLTKAIQDPKVRKLLDDLSR